MFIREGSGRVKGKEGSKIEQRENLICDGVPVKASINPPKALKLDGPSELSQDGKRTQTN